MSGLQNLADIVSGRSGGRGDEIVNVSPFLCPHVAEELSGDKSVWAVGGGSVFLDELAAGVGV